MQEEVNLRELVTEAVMRALLKSAKPEHMTHLVGDELVCKDHPRIAFRGAIDSLESEIILFQTLTEQKSLPKLTTELEEIIKTIRWLLRCEVSGEPVGEIHLQGLNTGEMRERSHHPSQYYGSKHVLPDCRQGEITAHLNHLRTKARETELSAYRAFRMEDGGVEREDILKVLNRMSSLFWIMMFKCMNGEYEGGTAETEGKVMVEASGRHIHLCREDVELLFGKGYQLTKVRNLSQPGQFVCQERLTLSGPRNSIQNVVILGPERKETQAEISVTDGLLLGIQAPVRLSGDIAGTPGMTLSNGDRKITKDRGVIIAKRHMHVARADAEKLGVKDKEALKIEVAGSRPVIFEDTIARISDEFSTSVHIDYDEANACGFEKGMYCRIVR